MRFHKRKCIVLHLGRNKVVYEHVPGAKWLESSSFERHLDILVDSKLVCEPAYEEMLRELGFWRRDGSVVSYQCV